MGGQPPRVVDLTAGNHQTHPVNLPAAVLGPGSGAGLPNSGSWPADRASTPRPPRPLGSGPRHVGREARRAVGRPQRCGRRGHEGLPLPRLLAAHPAGTPHVVAWPAEPGLHVDQPGRGTSALAHRLLAAPPVTPIPSAHRAEIFTTEVGDSGRSWSVLHGLFGQGKNWTGVAKALSRRHPGHPGRPAQPRAVGLDRPLLLRRDGRRRRRGVDGVGSDEPLHLVGHSMGGKVAMAMALAAAGAGRAAWWWSTSRRCATSGSAASPTTSPGCARLDLAATPDRAAADAALRRYVPDPVGARVPAAEPAARHRRRPGWRWQMNLDLLGDHLAELGRLAGPATRRRTPGPVLWLAGADSDYITPEYAPTMRAPVPAASSWSRSRTAGHWVHCRTAGDLRRGAAPVPRPGRPGGAPRCPRSPRSDHPRSLRHGAARDDLTDLLIALRGRWRWSDGPTEPMVLGAGAAAAGATHPEQRLRGFDHRWADWRSGCCALVAKFATTKPKNRRRPPKR